MELRSTVARAAIVVALGASVAAAACAARGPANVYGGPPTELDRDAGAAPGSADPAKPPVDPSPTPTQPRAPAPMYGAPPPPEQP